MVSGGSGEGNSADAWQWRGSWCCRVAVVRVLVVFGAAIRGHGGGGGRGE